VYLNIVIFLELVAVPHTSRMYTAEIREAWCVITTTSSRGGAKKLATGLSSCSVVSRNASSWVSNKETSAFFAKKVLHSSKMAFDLWKLQKTNFLRFFSQCLKTSTEFFLARWGYDEATLLAPRRTLVCCSFSCQWKNSGTFFQLHSYFLCECDEQLLVQDDWVLLHWFLD